MPPELYADLQTMSLRLFLPPCEGLSAPSVPPALHSTQMQRHEIYIFFGQEVMTKLFSESVSSLNMFTGLLNAYSLAFSLESCYPNTLKYHSALIHPAPRGSTATNGAAEIISFSSAVSIFTPLPSPCPAESVKNRARTRPQVCIDRLRETPSQADGWCRGFFVRAGRPTSNSRRPVRGQRSHAVCKFALKDVSNQSLHPLGAQIPCQINNHYTAAG